MNYHSFNWIMNEVEEHYDTALQLIDKNNIVAVCLQGSQNYGLDYEGSDVDTKCITTPSFRDICLLKNPLSTTHVRPNNSHVDLKDIRKYCECFRKQNLNFLEILFTNFMVVNGRYADEWGRLIEAREWIARMNPYRAVRSMYGIAGEKYHAMCHPYPSKMDIIEKHGYDGKQVSHLLRVEDYLERYIAGESYEACLHPTPSKIDEIMAYKLQQIPLEVAQPRADAVYEHCKQIKDMFCDGNKENENEEVRMLLEDVQCNIMRISVQEEFK